MIIQTLSWAVSNTGILSVTIDLDLIVRFFLLSLLMDLFVRGGFGGASEFVVSLLHLCSGRWVSEMRVFVCLSYLHSTIYMNIEYTVCRPDFDLCIERYWVFPGRYVLQISKEFQISFFKYVGHISLYCPDSTTYY